MDSYFDIKALPNAEILQSAVIAHLMQKLHRVLPQYCGRIGLSFPAYGQQRTLGGIIRVLGVKSDVEQIFQQLSDMAAVKDYGLITQVNVIPLSVTKHVFFTRVHAKGKSRFERLKKRHLQRGTWTSELEVAALDKMKQPLHLPHVSLKSASTGENFLLFLNRRMAGQPIEGVFNGYGISKTATVPWF
ncbi:type I-F CRISPR-associated endoribonuclease Cas6/Csy4 [Zhongshania guokunii]|uniref:Type I-F CRISPR-associated endoribonuclease Cas6/Csy4 n=1 Tax=Zhongshania guokunii TaxID=641783 RepID=A0ABV3U7S9_9GAMM